MPEETVECTCGLPAMPGRDLCETCQQRADVAQAALASWPGMGCTKQMGDK